MTSKTKQAYEEYLNEVGENMTLDALQQRYNLGTHVIRNHELGTFLRKYDPIQFEVGFEEWEAK